MGSDMHCRHQHPLPCRPPNGILCSRAPEPLQSSSGPRPAWRSSPSGCGPVPFHRCVPAACAC
eukprot:scaffold118787_cov23-Tisochrysis_lutea.AAC.5